MSRYHYKCNILRNDQNYAEVCFLAFFPEVAKLLRAATFLDTAARYHLYVVVVLKMHTRGATTKLVF